MVLRSGLSLLVSCETLMCLAQGESPAHRGATVRERIPVAFYLIQRGTRLLTRAALKVRTCRTATTAFGPQARNFECRLLRSRREGPGGRRQLEFPKAL